MGIYRQSRVGGMHASTSFKMISMRYNLFKAINIHQRLISPWLSYRKPQKCNVPQKLLAKT